MLVKYKSSIFGSSSLSSLVGDMVEKAGDVVNGYYVYSEKEIINTFWYICDKKTENTNKKYRGNKHYFYCEMVTIIDCCERAIKEFHDTSLGGETHTCNSNCQSYPDTKYQMGAKRCKKIFNLSPELVLKCENDKRLIERAERFKK